MERGSIRLTFAVPINVDFCLVLPTSINPTFDFEPPDAPGMVVKVVVFGWQNLKSGLMFSRFDMTDLFLGDNE